MNIVNRLLFQKIMSNSFEILTIINPCINIWTFERSRCSTFILTVHGTKKIFCDKFDFTLNFCCINKCQFNVVVALLIDYNHKIPAYSLWYRKEWMEISKIEVAKQLKECNRNRNSLLKMLCLDSFTFHGQLILSEAQCTENSNINHDFKLQ